MEWDNRLVLDGRTVEDLRRRIGELAASYTPEWRFDPSDPDAGATLALVFADQMAGNLRRLNQTIGKYHTEFVNMLGLSLLPAYPASGMVTAGVVRETVPGVNLPRGSRVVGQQGEERVVFETESDLYVTAARLTDIVAISGRRGKIIPLRGGPRRPALLPGAAEEPSAREEGEFALFDFTDPGVQENALLLYHQTAFDVGTGAAVSVRLTRAGDGAPLGAELVDPERYAWSCYDGEGLAPCRAGLEPGGAVRLEWGGSGGKVRLDRVDYGLLCVRRIGPVEHALEAAGVEITSSCAPVDPEFVAHNDQDLERGRFLPFGETASLFDECYIGHDQIFAKEGALVTLRFTLSFQEKLVTFTPLQEQEELKVIKRRPKNITYQTYRTGAGQISLEYYNGVGWRRLPCPQDWSTLFDGEHPGPAEISFRCPGDWQSAAVGGYVARALRLRITRADNCYLQPCLHNMPVVEGLSVSYDYAGLWKRPQRLRQVSGTRVTDLTRTLWTGAPFTAFRPLPDAACALCLGFDAAMEGAPVSLFFDVAEDTRFESAPIAFEYSGPSGWKPLKVVDNTVNMSRGGTVVFMPPSDFVSMEVEGVARRWLRLVDESGAFDGQKRYHACIRTILPNTVGVRNVEMRGEESFEIRTATPHMSFPLSAENILSAEVFVSELGQLTQPEMDGLLRDRPEDVRVEYDFLGGIRAFSVRWSEVENFDDSRPGDRHYVIDRMNNCLLFGDGVRVRIPPAQPGVALTVQARCCQGERGNLPAGALNTLFDQVLYLEGITNPLATCGGSNIESISSAHRRGAGVVSGRGRLITELDYVRETAAFSDSIGKVRCRAGVDLEGREAPGAVTVAVLMKDYTAGGRLFSGIRERLRRRLLARSEATVGLDSLIVSEPAYVEITLDIWAQADDVERSFDMQNLIRERVEAFLSPFGEGGRGGWDIGQLPTEAQIGMLLHALRGPMRVTRYVATARYVDWRGTHETALDSLPPNPFAIAVSGAHRIFIELSR